MNTVIEVQDLQKTYKPKRGQHGVGVRSLAGIWFGLTGGEGFGTCCQA